MILEGYGIRLEPLTPQSAEIVRQWRNSPRILEQMEYREIITPEMQQKWLRKLCTDDSRAYFLIWSGQDAAGMIHLSEIDLQRKTAEAGLFIGNDAFMGTGLALGASLLILEYAFATLKLEKVFAKVRNTNEAALQYNRLLGFEKESVLNDAFSLYVLSAKAYLSRKEMLENLLD